MWFNNETHDILKFCKQAQNYLTWGSEVIVIDVKFLMKTRGTLEEKRFHIMLIWPPKSYDLTCLDNFKCTKIKIPMKD